MERKKVSSSHIRSIGYDAKDQILEIEFSSGTIIQYSRVSSEIQRRLMASTSMKSFFEDNVQDNFSEKRVR
jgi:KTSC domain